MHIAMNADKKGLIEFHESFGAFYCLAAIEAMNDAKRPKGERERFQEKSETHYAWARLIRKQRDVTFLDEALNSGDGTYKP